MPDMHLKIYPSLMAARQAFNDVVAAKYSSVIAREASLTITHVLNEEVDKYGYANQTVDCEMYAGLRLKTIMVADECSDAVKAKFAEMHLVR